MIFIDANVLLDFFLRRDPDAKEAYHLFSMAHRQEVPMVISSLSVSHCFYFVQKNLDTQQAYQALDKLNQLFILQATAETHILHAMKLKWDDFEDGIQYAIAKECACSYIVSRDKNGFKKSDIPVLMPKEAVLRLSE